jgi:methylmalonyl-CoA/ethylmalonyl-CoA epimerase
MILKVEHIGIAVKNITEANSLFQSLLGTASYKTESVETEGVITSFFNSGNTKIELLEAQNENSPVAKFIAKRGEGIHHIAFEVDDINKTMSELKEKGFELLSEEAKPGADNKLICFLHPKSTNGVLVELCQERISLKIED